ncbi:alginate lyase family protein [Nonlabens ulvanivorans]|uniref:alginate lyase family protein n=1 Tax=Nonlabens ulvanivorans TaxID=906888 RepID=UPI0037CA1CD5
MNTKINSILDFIKNMGWRYVGFRIWHLFQMKTGLFIKKFPAAPAHKSFISLQEWKDAKIPFFIESREEIKLDKNLNVDLEVRFRESVNNNITFFNSQQFQLKRETQWSVNPSNGYKYDTSKHWSQIADLSKEAGDIKFVWEKARFSFIYDILRYDYHSGKDQSAFILGEIEDFIDKNAINLGPQYKCSQEISLRVLNWTYALHYYKNSPALKDSLFDKIMNSIYWQLHHVRNNIHFSRIAVRNNHAITESLTLYLSGLLFPFIPETKKWSEDGLKWFEQEVDYQIYDDGTFLQYSMNYHRVVVQLLTWGIRLNDLNGLRFKDSVYKKAQLSLNFLDACLDEKSGKLPNYGSNDGALFFKFTDRDYRDYTSQLDDLRMALSVQAVRPSESFAWYGMNNPVLIARNQPEITQFKAGGYYIINEKHSKTFIRCGAYQDRPAQADNLHLDIWIDGDNYIWDCGSYKYNTEQKFLDHFMGTQGHNTVTVDGKDQMKKGGRFIWYYWVKKANAILNKPGYYTFNGTIDAFRHLGTIKHNRTVIKKPEIHNWKVEDSVTGKSNKIMTQHWNVNPLLKEKVTFAARDEYDNIISPNIEKKWYSSYYGVKEESIAISFSTTTSVINTQISIKP